MSINDKMAQYDRLFLYDYVLEELSRLKDAGGYSLDPYDVSIKGTEYQKALLALCSIEHLSNGRYVFSPVKYETVENLHRVLEVNKKNSDFKMALCLCLETYAEYCQRLFHTTSTKEWANPLHSINMEGTTSDETKLYIKEFIKTRLAKDSVTSVIRDTRINVYQVFGSSDIRLVASDAHVLGMFEHDQEFVKCVLYKYVDGIRHQLY